MLDDIGAFSIVGAIVLYALALACFVLSCMHFLQKGFLFNNAYIYASKQERESMNKKPHYRQSAIVLLLIGLIFLLNGFNILFRTDWIFYVIIAIVIFAIIYAIASSILIEKKNKK